MLSTSEDCDVATMAKAAAGVQKDLLTKEANGIHSKTQLSVVEKPPQDVKKKHDGIVVGSTKSSVQAVATGNVNRSGFTFNSSNLSEEAFEYDSSLDNASASSFDFHKDRAGNRPAMGPHSKPAPSKWDDAEKWLVSVSSMESAPIKSKPKSASLQVPQVLNSQAAQNPAKKPSMLGQVRQIGIAAGGHAPRTLPAINGIATYSTGPLETLLPSETIKSEGRESLPNNSSKSSVEWLKKGDTTKHISDLGEGASKFSFMASENQLAKTRSLPNPIDRYPLNDAFECGHGDVRIFSTIVDDDMLKPTLRTQKPTTDFPSSDSLMLDLNKCEPSSSPHEASYLPPPNLRSVSMRDMGTEMTPIASQEPSRTGTPNRATTPTLRSPVSSRPSTPGRASPTPSPQQGLDVNGLCKESESKQPELTEKELQAKTRQEILALGTQLGKANIAAWATREEEDADASKCLKNIDLEEVKKNVLETRAAAFEEAEKAKYMARYKREEAKIQAWENHEKAKAEAEMRRIEVKVERMRSHSHERLMNKLATTRRRSEEMRAAAEARRGEQATKTAQYADLIRRTGKMPSSFTCCSFCW
ncbi:hypothetical protein O6H91_19G033000 [Diphasiastrum complanatum]|uniref:Uncharacterized protein n=2 Tax=Diphasiastrum complanatum TaxID=34168 RepID=A0ACC2ATZ5_DIPCM|nr:hypothetical protein O6H91_19G033000 [Diphasiastrum complanatum]KAJ7520971.1 hypothetical protein O6H91_19G033000 [Diphasiastrum complanatum]